MTAPSARSVALDVVASVRQRDAYAHEVLARALNTVKLSDRDRGFATMLAYGTISCRGTLDEAVNRYLSPGKSLESVVADALAISAYELLFSHSAPHAAVSQGVDLVKSVRPAAAGLANAVLRKLAADADTFPWGDPDSDVAALARLYGHPEWIARLWVDELGHETAAAMMAADNSAAPLYLAHVGLERSYEEIVDALAREGAEPRDSEPAGCIEAMVPSRAVASTVLARRDVVVCDAAAQFAVGCIKPAPGKNIVEIGAGRGTKSLLLAAGARLQGGRAFVRAVDSHQFKLDELKTIAQGLGLDEISTCCMDATSATPKCLPLDGTVDAVLVDAPCSGLGTLRRHPDRRWRAQPDEIETLAQLGSRLLERASRLVKPGGFVVYSTCTVASRENADVITAFLESESGTSFELDSVAADAPQSWQRWISERGWFQSLPEQGGPDGHFVARLIRRD